MKKTTFLLVLTTLVCKPMKTIPLLQFTRLPAAWLREAGALRRRGIFLAVLAGCFAVGLGATHAATPTLQPLLQGKWPAFPRGGDARDVKVSGNYAYVADHDAGLQVIDVSNPTNCVRVGGYDTGGSAFGVAVAGNYAYVTDGYAGLQVINVSNPTNCVRVGGYHAAGLTLSVAVAGSYAYMAINGGLFRVIDVSNPTNCVPVGYYDTSGDAYGVAVSGNYAYVAASSGLDVIDVSDPTNCVRVGGYDTGDYAIGVAVVAGGIYVADGAAGLLVLPTLPNVQFTVRVDATPSVPFTLESATDLSALFPWTPLLTTNVPAMPFDYVDFDVKLSDKPQKYYRVRRP